MADRLLYETDTHLVVGGGGNGWAVYRNDGSEDLVGVVVGKQIALPGATEYSEPFAAALPTTPLLGSPFGDNLGIIGGVYSNDFEALDDVIRRDSGIAPDWLG